MGKIFLDSLLLSHVLTSLFLKHNILFLKHNIIQAKNVLYIFLHTLPFLLFYYFPEEAVAVIINYIGKMMMLTYIFMIQPAEAEGTQNPSFSPNIS